MERTTAFLQEFWRRTPVDQQLLFAGGAMLAFGFALLFWTPLGNRTVARYCFGMAVLCHLLMWGVAKQFAPAAGPVTMSAGIPTVEIAIDNEPDASTTEPDPLRSAVLDPRDRSGRIEAPRVPMRGKEDSPLAVERDDPQAKAPELPITADKRSPIQQTLHLAEPQRSKDDEEIEPTPAVEISAPKSSERDDPPKTTSAPRIREERLAVAPDDPNPEFQMPKLDGPKAKPWELASKPIELAANTSSKDQVEFAPTPAPKDAAKADDGWKSREDQASKQIAKAIRSGRRDAPLATADRQLASNVPVPKTGRSTAESSAGSPLTLHGSNRAGSLDPDLAGSLTPTPAPIGDGQQGGSGRPNPTAKRAIGSGGDLSGQRSGNQRKELLERFGGNTKTEEAVADALKWLAAHQDQTGKWDGDGFHHQCPDGDKCEGKAIENGSDVGISALAILAFLGAGHTHRTDGPYRETVRKGLNWLLLEQREDGDLQGRERQGRVYSHAMATLVLTEAYQMTADERLKPYCQKAIDWLVHAQAPDLGGWRYSPRIDSDTSVFGWAVLALASGRQAGLNVPEACWKKAQTWLSQVSSGASSGIACYQPGRAPSAAMTAEALVCRQLFGLARDSDASAEAAIYILERSPKAAEPNVYYWYYGTLAMFQIGGTRWERWNDSMQRALLDGQRRNGHQKGSWDPVAPWGIDGGRVFSTSASALCLEVYYRHLPIYKDSSDSR